MKPQTIIFLGSSGCGKGTQTRRISDFLVRENPERHIIELGMGDAFRDFWKGEGYTQDLSRDILKKGGLQPAFLQVYVWTRFFIEHLNKDSHLLIDGTPRRVEDAEAMDSAFTFFERERPVVIYLRVSREWARERMRERAKKDLLNEGNSLRALEDSDEQKIENRLDWFEAYALPAIDFFREKDEYTFIEVNGEQSIEGVTNDILARAFSR